MIPTAAGHDAGVLAAHVPTAMLFVRNPSGVSHAPEEHADAADCVVGIDALADVLENLLTGAIRRPDRDGCGDRPSGDAPVTVYRCAQAWIDGAVRSDVDIACADGMITPIAPAAPAPPGAPVESLPGLVLPGFADAHSHAFHRGAARPDPRPRRAPSGPGGSGCTQLADRLDPDSLRELALARLRGAAVRRVHRGRGVPLPAPPARAAGRTTTRTRWGWRSRMRPTTPGSGLTLLDVAYLAGGFGEPVAGAQQRFSDGTARRLGGRGWRVADLRRCPAASRVGVGDPLGARGAAAPAAGGGAEPPATPTACCTRTCPSSRRRTTPRSPRPGRPRRSCSPTPARSARGPRWCTPPT